jgi:hypothetical protein
MIFGSIPNYVFADSQSESMIKIAIQARDQLKIQLSKTNSSNDLNDLFNEGLAKVELLKEAAKIDDTPKAREYFLSAMKIFREISQQITQQQSLEIAKSAAQSQPSRSNEIERLERYLNTLKGIANKNNLDVDFSKIEKLIENAKQDQKDVDYDERTSREEIKREIIILQKSLKEKTSSSTTERAKSFAKKHLYELDRLISQAKEIGVSDDTIKQLYEARGNLDETSDVEQIIREVKHLISVTAKFEETKSERIKSRINQLETKYDRLSNYENSGEYDLDRAQKMISELKNLIEQDKLSEAISMLHSLSSYLDEIDTSISTKQDDTTVAKEISVNSLDESKVDRIKVKIERLEEQLKQLADQIEEDFAKRWLESAKLQLENAKSYVDDSPDEALKTIIKIEQVIERIKNTIQ